MSAEASHPDSLMVRTECWIGEDGTPVIDSLLILPGVNHYLQPGLFTDEEQARMLCLNALLLSEHLKKQEQKSPQQLLYDVEA